MGNVNLTFLQKKYIPTTKRAVMEHMPEGCTTNAMESNFKKSYENDLINKHNLLQYMILQKKI